MARIYAALIRKGIKTLEDVPARLRDAVAALLQEDGFESFVGKRGDYYVVCQGIYSSLTEVRRAEQTLYENGYETRIAPVVQ